MQTGLTYLRARYYDSEIGRFLTQDTWQGQRGNPITLHKYLYANGNPVMFTDPTGKFLAQVNAISSMVGILVRASIGKSVRLFVKKSMKAKKFKYFRGTRPLNGAEKLAFIPLVKHHFVFVEPIIKFKRFHLLGTAYDPDPVSPEAYDNSGKISCNSGDTILNYFGEKGSGSNYLVGVKKII